MAPLRRLRGDLVRIPRALRLTAIAHFQPWPFLGFLQQVHSTSHPCKLSPTHAKSRDQHITQPNQTPPTLHEGCCGAKN
ncbi:uncharacterized protein K460DRAFT_172589 [Cucurbitaria berberidis CBS 394.84]|uniref:Uncharacterized protein n=1 Tax=Cucurbitaria berberidis CBS 394.84 TaxID=1168544 RepID=A0A9P4L595_9PLEO|nr:uncharacterized protein K460DRAFT_172589 [Cucurbitaria berberidis CBS 394.84]KAF1841748.1 hypothetical protein K460DRAFT_172589 [Cucurbitaria berberidis CBS 394.84]